MLQKGSKVDLMFMRSADSMVHRFVSMITKKGISILPFVFLIFLSTVSGIIWVGGLGHVIYFNDANPSIFFPQFVWGELNAWNPQAGMGSQSLSPWNFWTLDLLLYPLSRLGLPSWSLDLLTIVLIQSLTGISMFLFTFYIIKSRLPALGAALVYSYNFYIEHQIIWEVLGTWFAYALLPYLLLLIRLQLERIKRNDFKIKYILLYTLVWYFILPGINSAGGLVYVFILLVYSVFITIEFRLLNTKSILLVVYIIFLLVLTTSDYYFIYAKNTVETILLESGGANNAKISWINLLLHYKNNFGYLFLLTGTLKNYIDFSLFSLIVTIVGIVSLLTSKKLEIEKVFWAALFLLSIIFVAGPAGIFSRLFDFYFFSFKYSIGINYTAAFFGALTIFSLAIMFGYGLKEIKIFIARQKFAKNFKKLSTAIILTLSIVVILLPYNLWFPLSSAQLDQNPNLSGIPGFRPAWGYPSSNITIPSNPVIPSYDLSLNKFLYSNLKTDERVLVLPISSQWIITTNYSGLPLFAYARGSQGLGVIYELPSTSPLMALDDPSNIIFANKSSLFSLNLTVRTVSYSQNIQWATKVSNLTIQAKYFPGWQPVVRTDGSDANYTISFPTLASCPYVFPTYSPSWLNAYNSTLVYIQTNNSPLIITSIYINGDKELPGGVFWESGYMGMSTKAVTLPIVIPSNQKAIMTFTGKADLITFKVVLPLQYRIQQLVSLLKLMRIRYIVLLNNAVYFPYISYPIKFNLTSIRIAFNLSKEIKFVRNFGQYSLYEVQGQLAPDIFIIPLKGPFNPSMNYIFNSLNLSSSVQVSYYKLSDTRYSVYFKDYPGLYLLVLNSAYNRGWQIISTNGASLSKSTDQQFLEYANSWIIQINNTSKIYIEYSPQSVYSLLYFSNLVIWISDIVGVFMVITSKLSIRTPN
jgi:hypothetical protein